MLGDGRMGMTIESRTPMTFSPCEVLGLGKLHPTLHISCGRIDLVSLCRILVMELTNEALETRCLYIPEQHVRDLSRAILPRH